MKDVLDTETSVSAGLTDTGVELKAKSRFIAALDRLAGNVTDFLNAPLEARVSRQRARTEGEIAVIEATVKAGIKGIEADPEMARRVLEHEYKGMLRKRENVEGVLNEAIEDLRHSPPTDTENASGEAEIDPEFLESIEERAERASTEKLRQKWGRVLSAEIKVPGTFDRRAMRIVDELDAGTASLFQSFCENRFHDIVPRCLSGELPFDRLRQLVVAGLVVDPGIAGHIRYFTLVDVPNHGKYWAMDGGDGTAIGFPEDQTRWASALGSLDDGSPLFVHQDKPAVPGYLVTDTGFAISKIFPRPPGFSRYKEKLKSALPPDTAREFGAMRI